MRLAEVMTTPVETLPSSTSADEAWEQMRLHRIRHIVVIDADGKVEGVVSERDLGGRHGAELRDGKSVGDLMTATVVTATPDTTVREAANLLRGHTIGCLPVVQKRRPVGMVTVSDLLALIGRGAERLVVKIKRWMLRYRGLRKEGVRWKMRAS